MNNVLGMGLPGPAPAAVAKAAPQSGAGGKAGSFGQALQAQGTDSPTPEIQGIGPPGHDPGPPDIQAAFQAVLGGVAGYAIGYALFDSIEPWLRETHYWGAYETSRNWFDEYGVWIVFVAGFSPIPYKVFTIAAGVAVLNLPAFVIASTIGRAGGFCLVAGLVRAGGQGCEDGLAKSVERIGWAVVAIAAFAIAGFMIWGQ